MGELVALEGLVEMVDSVSGIGSIWRIGNIGDLVNMVEFVEMIAKIEGNIAEELVALGAPSENWLDSRIGNIRRIGRDLKILKI